MRILLTRPLGDAQPLARMLEELGHEVLVAPLMTIETRRDAALPLEGARAILLTSANGARALAAHPRGGDARGLPVFAVGEATAEAARAAGYADVTAAGGNVERLAALVAASLAPDPAPLVHVAGRDLAGDLAGALSEQGYRVIIAALYAAEAAACLPAPAVRALETGTLDAALLFSPRSAALFARLAIAEGLAEQTRGLVYFALSEAVAAALEPLGARDIAIAREPSLDALLERVAARQG